MKNRMLKVRASALVFAFLLLLISSSSPSILTNQPSAGQMLSILGEGAGNATALVRLPDGTTQPISLVNGQASVNASLAGRYYVQIKNETAMVQVRPAPPNFGSGGGGPIPIPALSPLAWVFFLAAIVALFVLVGWALRSTLFAPPIKGAILSKERQGGEVAATLTAGERPLSQAELEDCAGPLWTDGPLKLKAKTLKPGQSLTLRYAYSGPLSPARARFVQDGREFILESAQGSQSAPAAQEPDVFVSPPAGPPPPGKKRLARKE